MPDDDIESPIFRQTNPAQRAPRRPAGQFLVRPQPPRSGDVLRLDRAASVQFVEPILLRVIRVHDWPTYDGWCWLDGYQLGSDGAAVTRRSVFVQLDGVRRFDLGARRGGRPTPGHRT